MNKRPKEIKDILEYVKTVCPSLIFKKLNNYITQLEDFQQEVIAAEERNIDDGK